ENVDIFLLPGIHTLAQCGRKRMIFMQDDGDLPVAGADDQLNVQSDQRPQPFFRIGNFTYGGEDTFLGDVHGMIHDVEEDLILAAEVVVKASLAELQRPRDVIHRGGIVAPLTKQSRGGAENLLAGTVGGLTRHAATMVNRRVEKAKSGS